MIKVEQVAQVVSPNGSERLSVPVKVFEALREFQDGKRTGSITLDIRSGGVAGVRVTYNV